MKLSGKVFDFRIKRSFPKRLSKQFLLVDLLNNLNQLAEDREAVLQNAKKEVLKEPKVIRLVNLYGSPETRRMVSQWRVRGWRKAGLKQEVDFPVN